MSIQKYVQYAFDPDWLFVRSSVSFSQSIKIEWKKNRSRNGKRYVSGLFEALRAGQMTNKSTLHTLCSFCWHHTAKQQILKLIKYMCYCLFIVTTKVTSTSKWDRHTKVKSNTSRTSKAAKCWNEKWTQQKGQPTTTIITWQQRNRTEPMKKTRKNTNDGR